MACLFVDGNQQAFFAYDVCGDNIDALDVVLLLLIYELADGVCHVFNRLLLQHSLGFNDSGIDVNVKHSECQTQKLILQGQEAEFPCVQGLL